jgi:uncharacterized ubiquitin-like protein YukD
MNSDAISGKQPGRPVDVILNWLLTIMGTLNVDIHDATGNKRQPVSVPDDAPVDRLIAVLIDRMRFPQHGPDGQLLSYKLQHKQSGRQLLDDQTLAAAGVREGDTLRLMPEITAGLGSA